MASDALVPFVSSPSAAMVLSDDKEVFLFQEQGFRVHLPVPYHRELIKKYKYFSYLLEIFQNTKSKRFKYWQYNT